MPWPKELEIDCNGTGDNLLVPAVAGQIIEVWQLFLVVSVDTILTFKDGASTTFTGPMTMMAGGAIVLDPADEKRDPMRPWFTTSIGNAFIVNQTAAAQISGRIYYFQGRPRNVP